jgi:hypothetical protein
VSIAILSTMHDHLIAWSGAMRSLDNQPQPKEANDEQ